MAKKARTSEEIDEYNAKLDKIFDRIDSKLGMILTDVKLLPEMYTILAKQRATKSTIQSPECKALLRKLNHLKHRQF